MKGRNVTQDRKPSSPKSNSKPLFASAESRKLGLLLSTAQSLEQIRAWRNEDDQKLLFLCHHYEISTGPDMFKELALVLARELYPEEKKRGRKSKWVEAIKAVLVVEIERLVKPHNANFGVEWACKQLAKREPWKSFLEIKESEVSSVDPAEALRKVYFNFRANLWVKTARGAFLYHEQEGDIDGWENLLTDFVRKEYPK